MSKYYVHTRRVMHDIHVLSGAQLEEAYAIKIEDNNTVWDTCEGKVFDTLLDWALFIEQQEQEDEVIVPKSKYRYDDD